MGLSTNEAGSAIGGGSGLKITDGVYANLKKIEKVRDLSGKKIEHIDKAFDLALEVQYEGDRFPQLYIGNFKTDASGQVTGWGGAFVIALLFENTENSVELNDNNRFEKSDLKNLIGEELYTVSYTAGTYKKDDGTKGNSYKTWNMTFPVLEDEEELAKEILDKWLQSRGKGYPKDYTLPMNADPSTGNLSTGKSNKSGASKASVTEGLEVDDMDDDLPF